MNKKNEYSEENKLREGASFAMTFAFFPSFGVLTILWFIFGQLLMIALGATNEAIVQNTNFIVYFSETIPSIKSIINTNVFNENIAIFHYSIMWAMSFVFCLISVFASVGHGERKLFYKAKAPKTLAVLYLAGAIFNMFTEFYTGFYSFGLAKYQQGFAFLSSFSTFILPYAVRYIFLVLKIGVKND